MLEGIARESFSNLSCKPKGALYHYTSTSTAEKLIAGNSIEDEPMWYMYADHGKGVGVGFDGGNLIDAHQKNFVGFREPFSTAVIYDVRQLKRGIATRVSTETLLRRRVSRTAK